MATLRGLSRRRSLGGKGVFRDAWCVIGPKLASWEVIWPSRVMRDLLFSQRVTRDFPLKFPWWLMSFEARSRDWLIIDSYDTNFLPSFLDLDLISSDQMIIGYLSIFYFIFPRCVIALKKKAAWCADRYPLCHPVLIRVRQAFLPRELYTLWA